MHSLEWLNICLEMRGSAETVLSGRARQITVLSKEDDREKTSLVVKTWWGLKDAAALIERAAHTLHTVLEAAYKISRIGGGKSRAMKALVSKSVEDYNIKFSECKMSYAAQVHVAKCNSVRRQDLRCQRRSSIPSFPDLRLRL